MALFSFGKRKKLGLALGGGAARGLAHIGVLKVLDEERIPVSCVAGSSAGSLIGVLYCYGYGWREIRDLAREIDWTDLVTMTLPRMGLVNAQKLEGMVRRLIKGKRIEDLRIPFRAVAVDIARAEEVVLQEGPAARAVRASSSIPGIFEPTPWEGRLLVDGGIMNNVPADVARRMGADVVVGVNLSADLKKEKPPENLLDVVLYSLYIMIHGVAQEGLGKADLIVAPDLRGFGYHNLNRLDEMIDRGERAMLAQLGNLRRKLK